jgi:hypothetical protein
VPVHTFFMASAGAARRLPPTLRRDLSISARLPHNQQREIRAAIEFHIEGLREDSLPIPQPSSAVRYVEIAA